MRALYEIRADIARALNQVDPLTGEWIGAEAYEALCVEEQDKIEGVALSIKQDAADIAAIEHEIEVLEARRDKIEKTKSGKEGWLKEQLQGQKFSTGRCEVKFTRSQSVVIEDEAAFCKLCHDTCNDDFVIHKEYVTEKPNKENLKKFLKSGGEMPGARLQLNLNMKVT